MRARVVVDERDARAGGHGDVVGLTPLAVIVIVVVVPLPPPPPVPPPPVPPPVDGGVGDPPPHPANAATTSVRNPGPQKRLY